MNLYVLDTDHLSLLRYGHAEVAARLESTPREERAITIVSVEEQLRAWFTQVQPASSKTINIPGAAIAFELWITTGQHGSSSDK